MSSSLLYLSNQRSLGECQESCNNTSHDIKTRVRCYCHATFAAMMRGKKRMSYPFQTLHSTPIEVRCSKKCIRVMLESRYMSDVYQRNPRMSPPAWHRHLQALSLLEFAVVVSSTAFPRTDWSSTRSLSALHRFMQLGNMSATGGVLCRRVFQNRVISHSLMVNTIHL